MIRSPRLIRPFDCAMTYALHAPRSNRNDLEKRVRISNIKQTRETDRKMSNVSKKEMAKL